MRNIDARGQSSGRKIDPHPPHGRLNIETPKSRFSKSDSFSRFGIYSFGCDSWRREKQGSFHYGPAGDPVHPSEQPRGKTTFADDTPRDRLQIPTRGFAVALCLFLESNFSE
ncbi:hypothetical protein AVEN_563-1 [Araneus ventricosus]|uniref:Uncharacterized protein n=1 Tax=Araneus ventricosus TaxID=182803 RepID=A0A4Y2RHV4_ARAVE|nr:hypothetical protein AVEN_563-1 [Araneus ventricosus]